jgi:TatD DNase family protein
MIDSHTHLDHPSYQEDIEEVLARAVEDGVSAVVNVGYDRESARATTAFVQRYPFFFGVLGTHPHDAVKHDLQYEVELKALLDRPGMIGVGEIGLDYHYDHSPRDIQRKVFRRMLWMARLKDKPIVIHCREAERDVLDMLVSERMEFRGIFHAFSHDASVAARAADLGLHLGIGGVATFAKSGLADILRTIPLDRVVLETDCPYLTPHPFRGKRNEPALVGLVVDALARLHGMSPETVIRQTTENFLLAMRVEKKSLPAPVYKIGNRVYIQISPDRDPAALADRAVRAASGGGGRDGEETGLRVVKTGIDGDDGGGDAVEEAVICGLREPLESIDHVRAIGRRLRSAGIRVRVFTGRRGHVGVGKDAVDALRGFVDRLSVRMNGPTAAQHERVANTGLGDAAFGSLVELARLAVAAGLETECVFVAAPKTKLEPCLELANSLGAGCVVRKLRSL